MTFASNLRLTRIAAGWSQERLAAEAGLDRTFISSVERGVRNISIDNVERLAAIVGLPAHRLLDPELQDELGLTSSAQRAVRQARLYPTTRRTRGSR